MSRPWLRWSRRQFVGWGLVMFVVNMAVNYGVLPLIGPPWIQVLFVVLVVVPLWAATFYVIFAWARHWDRQHPR